MENFKHRARRSPLGDAVTQSRKATKGMTDDRSEPVAPSLTPAASRRQTLSNRRPHELVDFQHGGRTYTAGVGRFPDGSLAEIFLNGGKIGTDVENAARDSAVVVSIALQHGTPAETIRHAVTRNRDGSATGPLGALLDLLAIDASAAGNGQ